MKDIDKYKFREGDVLRIKGGVTTKMLARIEIESEWYHDNVDKPLAVKHISFNTYGPKYGLSTDEVSEEWVLLGCNSCYELPADWLEYHDVFRQAVARTKQRKEEETA